MQFQKSTPPVATQTLPMSEIERAPRSACIRKAKEVLIVDDDPGFQDLIKYCLELEGYKVTVADSLQAMEKLICEQTFSAVILDYCLGEENGLKGIEPLLRLSPGTRVIMLTGHGSIELAVDAMNMGASYFLTKGCSPDKIAEVLAKILRYQGKAGLSYEISEFEESTLIGASPEFVKVINKIERFKNVDSTILISGESGTGKELIARAIHFSSQRKGKPFRAINCAAIPENLIESELFGHKKGAFTDAKADRKGLFEECMEGTLLLDEIGEMPISVQAKLLRVLQEREITPVGSTTPIKINTRVIASTNRNLKSEVELGRFRKDLFFRLSILTIKVPPLRKRADDVPLLVSAFIQYFNEKFEKSVQLPSRELMSRLIAARWPGNVRELRNAIERAVVLSDDDQLHIEDVFQNTYEADINENFDSEEDAGFSPPTFAAMHADKCSLPEVKRQLERDSLVKVLKETNGNVSKAAKILGLYRAHVYRILNRHAINPAAFKH